MSSQEISGSEPFHERGEQIFPCSASQRPFWFMHAVDPDNAAPNIALRWELEGRINPATVERAFQTIIDRHEILRTRIIERDGAPLQAVADHYDFRLSVVDLTMIPEARRLDDAMALVRLEARRPFDIEKLPLIRATLLRLAPDRAFVALTVHHIVFDGWSISIIAREFGLIAEALDVDRPVDLPELPLQYADYARWEKAYFASTGFDESIAYWKRKLAGAPYFEVPSDRPRVAGQPKSGEITAVQLPPALGEKIEGIGRSRNLTVFVFGCAVITAMLSRYTGKSDILLATQSAGRDDAELETMIGPFINNLVLRFDASGDPSFETLLERVNSIVQEAVAHGKMPFHKLVELLNPSRNFDRPHLASVNFTVFRDVVHRTRYGNFYLSGHPSASTGALYDLNFFLAHWPNGWRIAVEYNPNLFEKSTADRLVAAFAAAFEFAFAHPDAKLSAFAFPGQASGANGPGTAPEAAPAAISPPPEAQRRPSSAERSVAEADDLRQSCIHDLFEAQVARTPATAAVSFEGAEHSYGELNAKANRLARHLRDLGVGPDSRVALCVERGLELVVGLLAILKAGGAYVPLDPAYPADRLAFMLEDSAPVAILTQRQLKPLFANMANLPPIVDLAGDASAWERQADTNLDRRLCGVRPDHLAYIIYTSGSTGKPKGVMVEHRNVTRLFATTSALFGFTARDVWTLFHSYAFDFSVWEIWGALLYGGRLVVVPHEKARSPEDFYRLLCRERVTVLNQTPSAFRQLIAAQADSSEEHELRYVIFGGEALEVTTLKPWYNQERNQRTQLVNMYGITETTVHVTFQKLEPVDVEKRGSPIGRPLLDLQAYLLDAERRPVQAGAVGEMFVGGAGVARGYLNRPELTAERFLADPFADDANARMYRSGDLARLRPDGTLEFLGRNDFQVKIRGFRIELGEIEARLAEYPSVRETVVLAREDQNGEKQLVAYYTAAAEIAAERLRAHLLTSLPEHMAPAAYVRLKALPLTANGKLDRNALPAPDDAAFGLRGYEAPANEIEETLAALWEELLDVERVGRQDNFFDLGGHSMMATRLVARVSRKLGVKIGVVALFKAPTLREFAAYLAKVEDDATDSWRTVRIQPEGDKTPIVAINDPLLYYSLARQIGADRPFFGVALFDPADPHAVERQSMNEIAAEYVRLIRQMQPHGPYVLCGYCVAGIIAYEAARQLRAQGEKVPLVVIADSWAPGYVRKLPFLRRFLAEAAFRLHVLRHQFGEVRRGEMTFGELLASYRLVRKSRILDLGVGLHLLKEKPHGRNDGEDQWFLGHLNAARDGYQIEETPGDVLLLQSDIILTRFTEPGMGWSPLVKGRLIVQHVPGWHGDMFVKKGTAAIAGALRPLLKSIDETDRASS